MTLGSSFLTLYNMVMACATKYDNWSTLKFMQPVVCDGVNILSYHCRQKTCEEKELADNKPTNWFKGSTLASKLN